MKKVKILIPLLGVTSIAGTVAPLASCSKSQDQETATITFAVVGQASIKSGATVKVKVGTPWSEVTKPEYQTFDNNVFMGWYNGNNAMKNDDIVNGDMYITGRFLYKPGTVDYDDFDDYGDLNYIPEQEGYEIWPNTDSGYPIDGGCAIFPDYIQDDDGVYPVLSIILDSNMTRNMSTIYIPKFCKRVVFTGVDEFGYETVIAPLNLNDNISPLSDLSKLVNIFVDPENKELTTKDRNGNECNTLMSVYKAENAGPKQVVYLGTEQSIIPDGVDVIANAALNKTYAKNITLPETVKQIGNYAFQWCDFESINIPKETTLMGDAAFKNCRKLKTVSTVLDGKLVNIGDSAFEDCHALEEFSIPDNVEVIWNQAFMNCLSLKSLYVGKSVTYIMPDPERGTFEQLRSCKALETITVNPNNTAYSSGPTGSNCIMVKNGTENVLIFGIKTTVIPSDVTEIAAYAFNGCAIESVNIPSKVKYIREGAFSGCRNLKTVVISGNVQVIGTSAFAACINLNDLTITKGVKYIEPDAFYSCINLKSVTIPESVESADGWYSDDVPEEYHPSRWFAGCSSLETVNVQTKYVVPNAFSSCTNLANVTLSDKCIGICDGAFYRNSSLVNFTLPKSVKCIFGYGYDEPEGGAFAECTALTNFTIPADSQLVWIGSYAFADAVSLKHFTLPHSIGDDTEVEYEISGGIGAYAFVGVELENRTIDFDGTNEEWVEKQEAGRFHEYWRTGSNIRYVNCLKETQADKKVIDLDASY